MTMCSLQDEILKIPLDAFSYKLTRNLNNAKDLKQETYYKAFNKINTFKKGMNLQNWLMTIMSNTFKDNYRKSQFRLSVRPQFVKSNTVNEAIYNLEELDNKKLIKENCNSDEILMYYDEITYKEIAELKGIPINTVKTNIRNSRKILQTL